MLESSVPLDESISWDTNWARKFLKIPRDQLNKINNISEWSLNQILTTEKTDNITDHIVTTEKESLLQSNSILEKLSPSNSAAEDINNLKVSNLLNSTEVKLTTSASNFLDLHPKIPELIKLRSSKPAPNIKELVLSSNDITSVEHHTVSVTSPFRSESSKFHNSEGKFKDTIIVTTKFNEMESFSQPVMDYTTSSTIVKPLEKLTDNILNHRYLKGSRKSQETEHSQEPIQEGNKKSTIGKRLMLLEKRFSPSKECVSPAEEKSKQDDNLGNTKIQELSKPIFQAPKDTEHQVEETISKTVSNPCDMLDEGNGHVSTSEVQNSVQEFEANVSIGEKKDVSKYEDNQFVSPRDPAKNEESSAHEDTFGSQLPCGQPVPVESNACSEPITSKKASIEIQYKSAEIATNMVPSIGDSRGIMNIQNSHGGVRGSGTKRKRKSKVDTPNKIKDAKHSILFTGDQVRNMLEMIKMLHSAT